nr:MAG: nonstructural protein [Microvirus sp.]
MKKLIFTVFDSKALVYSTPFFSVNLGTALRDFAAACNDKNTELNKYSQDFSLHQIGEYDDDTGFITSYNAINLGLAAQFITLE